MSVSDILRDARESMEKGFANSKRDFSGIRSGKASPNMLDTIRVEAYGSMVPLNQVANVSAPEPRILIVTPFDKTQSKTIEKAIRESDLGLDPAVQGNIIRVPLPSMNEQRRKDLVKVLHKLAEDGRIVIRHVRTDARDQIKKLEGISEDDKKLGEKDVQKVHDEYIGKIDSMLKLKEAEVMEV